MNPNKLRRTYITALSVIALLVILAEIAVQYNLNSSINNTEVVKVADRQRTLSQKLAKSSLSMFNSNTSEDFTHEQLELRLALKLFSETHEALQNGSDSLGIGDVTLSDKNSAYFAEIAPFYADIVEASNKLLVFEYLNDDSTRRAQLSPIVNTIQRNEDDFLRLMDSIIFQYEIEATDNLNALRFSAYAAGVSILIAVIILAFFFFRPVIAQFATSVAEANAANARLKESEEEIRKSMEKQLEVNENLFLLQREMEKKNQQLKESESELLKSAEKQLEINEQLYISKKTVEENSLKMKAASELAKLAPWSLELNLDGSEAILHFSPEYYQIILNTTYQKQGSYDMPFETWLDRYVHPEDAEMIMQVLGESLQKTTFTAQLTFRVIQEGGNIIYNNVAVDMKHYPEENKVKGQGASQDVTQTKLVEEALREKSEQMKEALSELRMLQNQIIMAKDLEEIAGRTASPEVLNGTLPTFDMQYVEDLKDKGLPIPKDEEERLKRLYSYDILDTLPEKEFDQITKLASFICGTSISVISLVDKNRQWFKSEVGLGASETSREVSFCQYAIMDEQVLEVNNTLEDDRFKNNPLVTGDPNIRFYAGAPLQTEDGYNIGTLCVIDSEPKQLTEEQRQNLTYLSEMVMARLEALRQKKLLIAVNNQVETSFNTLKTTQEKLQDAFKQAKMASWNFNLKEQVFTLSDQYYTLSGTSYEEQQTYSIPIDVWEEKFLHPEDISLLRKVLEEVISKGEASKRTVQYRLIDQKTQDIITVESTVTPEKDTEDRVVSVKGTMQDITERKKAEQELQNLSLVASKTDNAVIITNADGLVEWVNDAFTTITEYTSEEVINKKPGDFLQGKDTDPVAVENIRKGLASNKTFGQEILNYTKSGNPYWLYLSITPIFNESGELERYIAIESEITERKESELQKEQASLRTKLHNDVIKELAAQNFTDIEDIEEAYKSVTEQATVGLDVDRGSIWLYGEDKTSIICKDLFELSEDQHIKGAEMSKDDFPQYFKAIEAGAAIAAHDIYTHEATADLSESYSKPLNIKSLLNVPIRLNGKVIGILCLENKYTAREWMLEEINFAQTVANFLSLALESIERYRAEEELRQSSDKQLEMAEQLYLSNRELEENSLKIKAASSLAKLAPWSLELNIDGTGAKLNLSDEYYTILLKTDAETQGSHEIGFEEWMEKFVYKPDHEIVFGALGGVLENKEFDAEVTFRLIQSDDSIIYNKVIVSTKHYPEEGKIRGRGASQDVTETKNAEEKLAQALEDQKIINESMLVAQRELARKNEALKSSEEELRKMVEQQLETNEKLLIAEHETKEALKHEQESKKELDNTIDQLKDAQSQLVHNEKMASLGQLTAGIAHEINNPINFVYNGIDTLKISLDELLEIVRKYEMVDEAHNKDEILKEVTTLKDELDYDELLEDINYLVGDIKKGAVRTMEIVKGLRVFSRLDEEEKKMASVTDCIDSTLVLLNNKTKNKVAVNKFYDDAIPEINCYPGQLNQVFMNILSNAVQAIPDERKDGKIDIYTENLEANVVIRIKDNGKGMSEQVKRRIFEPFFTTKAVGVGTGLGLSISYGIIEKHDGDIYVNSEEGKGTEFVIRLPKDLA